MSLLKFSANLPKAMQSGDEIVIKVKLLAHVDTFSIDFVEGLCPGSDIVYRIKITPSFVYQNWKQNGEWMQDDTPEDGYIINDGDDEVVLTFNFDYGEIYVYTGDESRDLQHSFRNQLPMYNIGSVQVWDDIKNVKEITFRYAD